jgi:hypothetical protein
MNWSLWFEYDVWLTIFYRNKYSYQYTLAMIKLRNFTIALRFSHISRRISKVWKSMKTLRLLYLLRYRCIDWILAATSCHLILMLFYRWLFYFAWDSLTGRSVSYLVYLSTVSNLFLGLTNWASFRLTILEFLPEPSTHSNKETTKAWPLNDFYCTWIWQFSTKSRLL